MLYAYPDATPSPGEGVRVMWNSPWAEWCPRIYPLKLPPVTLLTFVGGPGESHFASLPGPLLVRRLLRLYLAGEKKSGLLLSPIDDCDGVVCGILGPPPTCRPP
jgi:hypothetical protein